MKNVNIFKPLSVAEQEVDLDRLSKNILSGPENINPDYVKRRGWVVVPVESACHFDAQDIKRLCSAIASVGTLTCLALVVDDLLGGPMAYSVPVSEEGLLSFNREFSGLNSLLVPENESFAILCSVADYYLVAGQSGFVAAAVGGDIADARETFWRFASDPAWPDGVRDSLMRTARTYSSLGVDNR
jgi:hypothetical protein